MSGIKKMQFNHAQILYILDFELKKYFFMKTLLIPPKFHGKTLSRPGDMEIKENVHVYSTPIYGRSVK